MKMGLLGDDKPDVASAKTWLKKAIDRHMRHLSGEEPTDDDSQEKMMQEMEAALAALGGAE